MRERERGSKQAARLGTKLRLAQHLHHHLLTTHLTFYSIFFRGLYFSTSCQLSQATSSMQTKMFPSSRSFLCFRPSRERDWETAYPIKSWYCSRVPSQAAPDGMGPWCSQRSLRVEGWKLLQGSASQTTVFYPVTWNLDQPVRRGHHLHY